MPDRGRSGHNQLSGILTKMSITVGLFDIEFLDYLIMMSENQVNRNRNQRL